MDKDLIRMDSVSTVESQISLNIQRPKKILHFSDGILEEFSDSENESEGKVNEEVVEQEKITKSAFSRPWFLQKSAKIGNTILTYCDLIGENLASLLGITTPKYILEINEFRRNNEREKEAEKERLENASWQERKPINSDSNEVITKEITVLYKKF